METSEKRFLLALAYLPSFGPVRTKKLLSCLASAEALWKASMRELLHHGVPESLAAIFCKERSTIRPDECVEQCRKLDIEFLPMTDAAAPVLLREISDPPIGLFVCGTLSDAPLTLAVVGTRSATAYGRHITMQLVSELARAGVTIVSGLALGIDGVAHAAAVDAGGRTIAVLPCGLDVIYPGAHRGLAARIVDHGGALVSEFPPGTDSLKHHFPIRNRIIAGLASGTIVTEAPERSGALITAKLALDYNRDVFAVPGPITSINSRGTHQLLRDGAILVEQASDVLSQYHVEATATTPTEMPLNDTERLVLSLFSREPLTVDQIQNLSRLNTSVINATLVCLQMKGWIAQLDPLRFIRNR